jgi:hypothetical protein
MYDRHFLAKLAREFAMNIRNRKEILEIYKINEEEMKKIETISYFITARDQMIIEWNSALSTPQRLRLESLALLEEGLPDIAVRMTNPNEPLVGAVQTAKFLADLGGMSGESRQSISAPTDRFVITINLGNETIKYDQPVVDIAPNPEITALPKP